MPVRDDLGKRMKEYETRNRHYLQKRIPVIIRLDMRSGHTFTKEFERPFDEVFISAMQKTAKYLFVLSKAEFKIGFDEDYIADNLVDKYKNLHYMYAEITLNYGNGIHYNLV